jgi:transcriptional regulator
VYRPPAFVVDDAAARDLIASHPLAHLVVIADGSVESTPLPMVVRGTSLVGHVARGNPVWRHGGPAVAIFTGADGYVSPRWYEAKAADGRVVPTWNYTVVHARGTLVVHDDAEWKRELVTLLTTRFESAFPAPWSVDDAPADYIDGMLRGIVGLELIEVSFEAKAKLSQNRSPTDRATAAEGLAQRSPREQALADAMRTELSPS